MDDFQAGTELSVSQLREWLRAWIVSNTGLDAAEVTDDRPMEDFGLSSRDVVVLSGELENLVGVRLDATLAYEYPTISLLAQRLVDGPDAAQAEADSAAYVKKHASATALRKRVDSSLTDMDIAVIGMAGRYPGANNVDEMWSMLIEGRDGITEVPEGRWSEYAMQDTVVAKLAETDTRGGYLDDIESFDPEFFGLSPLEATNMDPQQRILLELTWEALEHAQLRPSDLRGEPVGVFMGSTNNDYGMLISGDPEHAHPYALTGNSTAIIANRLNYAFDFRGPSVAVDTACSSSLVAIHQAAQALRMQEAEVAVAGGVNILANPFATTAFGQLGVFSPTGKIHAFSNDADGFVRSDGAGVVILKRLEDAERDGDNVLAVIKGSAVNSDGRSNGLTAPNPDAQVDVLRRAYADAGIDPTKVDYVEAHGTGTILGDPIEASALATVLGHGRPATTPTLLGSAKTNFGHTEAAAGVAGLIKVVRAMQEDALPQSLHYAGPNPYVDFDGGRLEVVEDPREWPRYSGKAVAGVSAFGFGGTNAHVVVEEAPRKKKTPAISPTATTAELEIGCPDLDPQQLPILPNPKAVLLPVSGLLPSRRRLAAADLATWLREQTANGRKGPDLVTVARALAKRNNGRSRAVVPAGDTEQAIALLDKVAEGQKSPEIASNDAPLAAGPVWIFSGFGGQHRKMAKELYELSPFFANALHRIDEVIRFESGWSLVDLVLDDEQTYGTETAQVGITAIQLALIDLMHELGAKPAAVVGMSMGEIAAAYATGGLSWRDAIRIACHRSRLMGEGEGMLAEDELGAMAVVEFSVEELDQFIADHPDFAGVEPAVYSAPTMCTVGGPRPKVVAMVEYLEGQGKFARLLNVKGAGHTSMLDPILAELWAEISDITPQPLQVPLFSSVDRGREYKVGETLHTADYFVRCTSKPVWFSDAIALAAAQGHTTFVEFSPNPVALMPTMITTMMAGVDGTMIHLMKRKEDATDSLLDALAKLYALGEDIDLARLVGPGKSAAVPGVHWKHQKYWTAARPSSSGRAAMPGSKVQLPDGRIAFAGHAEIVPSLGGLIDSAVEQSLPSGQVIALEEYSELPASGDLTTIVTPNLAGATVQVFSAGEPMALLAEAAVVKGNLPEVNAAVAQVASPVGGTTGTTSALVDEQTPSTPGMPTATAAAAPAWTPESGVSVADHLRVIVSEAMGYEIDDLPLELPLIDLGLDSLMGMRIKNRIEHDFGLPSLQVQALRDASVADSIALVEQMVADKQKGTDAAAEAVAAAAKSDPAAENDAEPSGSTVEGLGVAPRDATERLVFGTWATITGKSAGGVTNALPELDDDTATALAARLSERVAADIPVDAVTSAKTLESLAEVVRPHLETDVDGNVRVLRERAEGSDAPSVFLFHPAGGSSAVYQPLMRRLPEDVPVYGIERVEGGIQDRAAQYLTDIQRYSDGRPVVLGGWSLGGALAYEVAHQLVNKPELGVTVDLIALLDTVKPSEPIPNTTEELHARWDRYAAFANKTYGLAMEVPHDMLEEQGEEAFTEQLFEMLKMMDSGTTGLSGGVLEHQRASFVDNRELDKVELADWADVTAPVVLFRAERMHDGAVELEPRYAQIDPDGGWSAIVEDLEIVQLRGDHLAVVDEPEISTVGARLSERIAQLRGGKDDGNNDGK
ncbi:polyketide synthase Pks13 [Corynebacterium ulceribovis]|uniref:polyketide synthase Pks13 n=1 Tax=Corynebacterium ulceribovis TaxID=487732 RepID=UPI00037474B3|nr:type I polyketide synthase [Corynebacterium ulceribovis]